MKIPMDGFVNGNEFTTEANSAEYGGPESSAHCNRRKHIQRCKNSFTNVKTHATTEVFLGDTKE